MRVAIFGCSAVLVASARDSERVLKALLEGFIVNRSIIASIFLTSAFGLTACSSGSSSGSNASTGSTANSGGASTNGGKSSTTEATNAGGTPGTTDTASMGSSIETGGTSSISATSNLGGSTNTGGTTSTGSSANTKLVAKAISAGYYHTCVVLNGGTIQCWGGNGYGALGNGTSTNGSDVPVTVAGITNATAVAAGTIPARF